MQRLQSAASTHLVEQIVIAQKGLPIWVNFIEIILSFE